MTKFFAVCNVNGLIAQELIAATQSAAIAEVKAAIADRAAVNWIDNNQTDLEDEVGVNCTDLSYSDALELCAGAGAEFVWGDSTGDSWDIWSVTTK